MSSLLLQPDTNRSITTFGSFTLLKDDQATRFETVGVGLPRFGLLGYRASHGALLQRGSLLELLVGRSLGFLDVTEEEKLSWGKRDLEFNIGVNPTDPGELG